MAVKFKDYYETLGVPRNATEKEIKASYRKLARQHHPDANKGNKASEEKFKEINEAYEVLKDPQKRQRYDQLGANYKAGADFRPPPDFGGFSFDFENMRDMGKGSPFSDFFDMLFGQSFSQAGSQAGHRQDVGAGQVRNRRALDQEADIELTIDEMAKGTTRTLQITAPNAQTKTLEVKIPAGVRPGSKIRVSGEGARMTANGQGGDLFLKVKAKPHPYFTVEGDNLISNLTLTPAQAVLGFETKVNTLAGAVKIRVPGGSQNGRLLRLRNRGLPKLRGETSGDQLVRIKVAIPVNPSEKEIKLYEQLLEIEAKKSS